LHIEMRKQRRILEDDRTVARGWMVEGPVFCVPR